MFRDKIGVLERDLLGFGLTQHYGRDAAFLSAGGYHHHIGLNTRESRGGSPPSPGTTGIPLDGAADHGVSEALYLRDPDENGVERYWDYPKDQWPLTPEGELAMYTRALDLDGLLGDG